MPVGSEHWPWTVIEKYWKILLIFIIFKEQCYVPFYFYKVVNIPYSKP